MAVAFNPGPVVPIRKARSEPRRHVVPGQGAGVGMVLLTKQDFEDLRSHATGGGTKPRSPSRELPRPQPMCSGGQKASSKSVGNSPAAPKALEGASLSAGNGTRWTQPKVERRVRSANGRRPPQLPPGGGCMKYEAAPLSEAKRQVHTDGFRVDHVQKPERLRKDASVVQPSRRSSSPTPKMQKLPNGPFAERSANGAPAMGLGVHGGPLSGAVAAAAGCQGALPHLKTRTDGTASCPPIPGGGPMIVAGGLQGGAYVGNRQGAYPPMRNGGGPLAGIARPADQVLRAVEMGLSVAGAVVVVKDNKPVAQEGLSSMGFSLQVSGLAKQVQSAVYTSEAAEAAAEAIEAEGWSSEEDYEESNSDVDADDSDGHAAFNYREYRYHQRQEARAHAAPEQPRGRAGRQRRAAPQARDRAREDSAGSGCDEPWTRGESPRTCRHDRACSSSMVLPQCLASASCYQEPPDEDVSYVAGVLVEFYGLPGGISHALRLKGTLVTVLENSWAQKQRKSQFTEPPMLWVRGGRVYDFHGDRGTTTEFGHDLLTRQVEDDAICRQRRREQGLLPFPFLPVPMKREEDADDQGDVAGKGANRGRVQTVEDRGGNGVWK